MKQRYEDLPINGEIIEFEGIPMQAYPPDNQRGDWNYRIQIQDFGCLTKENLTEFLHAEVKLLILGAKDWELEHSENVLNLIAEYKEIAYLFNFINGKQFQQVMKSMCHRNSYRIPYEPDPFGAITTKNGEELFSELLSQINKRSS